MLNKEVSRTIDASTSIVHIITDIKAVNVKETYDIIVENSKAKNLAFLAVTVKGKPLPVSPPVT